MTEQVKSADSLWQDYAFLTREILKFVQRKDLDMVLELLEQRAKLQLSLEQMLDQTFKTSPAGQALLEQLRQQNQLITNMLQRNYNLAKHNRQISNSYDQLGIVTAGSYFNRQS